MQKLFPAFFENAILLLLCLKRLFLADILSFNTVNKDKKYKSGTKGARRISSPIKKGRISVEWRNCLKDFHASAKYHAGKKDKNQIGTVWFHGKAIIAHQKSPASEQQEMAQFIM
jgi:hypothetical protein